MRVLLKILLSLVVFAVMVIVLLNTWVLSVTNEDVKDSIDEITKHKVALVLGTSKHTVGGGNNAFFYDRIQAAAELYQQGKVSYILVSGDNRTPYYNEPKDMQEALINFSVDRNDIILDSAGLRTFDSVIRSKEVFGFDDMVIVTQGFHAPRALFIARYCHIKAEAYAADYESQVRAPLYLREILARVLAVADVHLQSREHNGPKDNTKD